MRGALCNSSARLALILLLAVPISAQLSETIEVRVLELDVVVVDRAGKPVEGLTRDDFRVQVAGKPVDITNFLSIKRGTIEDQPAPATAEQRPAPGPTAIPTTVVLFIDETRLTPRSKVRAMEALREFVGANVGAPTSAMLVRWNGALNVRVRPTQQPGPLLTDLSSLAKNPPLLRPSARRDLLRDIDEALNGVNRQPDMLVLFQQLWMNVNDFGQVEAREAEQTLDALRETVRLASIFEGRKVLLYVSDGLPLQGGVEVFDYWERATHAQGTGAIPEYQAIARSVYNPLDQLRHDRSRQHIELSKFAQKSNVTFYAMAPEGAMGFESGRLESGFEVARLDTMLIRSNDRDGVRLVANETGGRLIADTNDLGQALAVLSEQFTTYYSIGIRPPARKQLSKISVTVKGRPGLRVMTAQHRQPLSREEEVERGVRARLYSLRAENPLGAELRVGTPSNVAGRCVVPVSIAAPRERADALFALLDEKMQESDIRRAPLGTPISLGLVPGKYVLSVGIADQQTGEMSYLQSEVDCR